MENPDVLLVDDNLDDIGLAMDAFEKIRIASRVRVARDGVEALQAIFGAEGSRSPVMYPRLVLLDLKLPRVDGLQVLQRLKTDHRTRPIPVVVLTASSLHRDVEECYRLGANSYIVKPRDFRQFEQVAEALRVYWLTLNHPAPEYSTS